MVANLLPAILVETGKRCSPLIGRDAFLSQQGSRLASRLQPLADSSWPTAKLVLERIGRNPLPDNDAILNAGRTVIASGIAGGMNEDACDSVSRLTGELATLPPENFAIVFALFLEFGIAANGDVPFKVCRTSEKVSG